MSTSTGFSSGTVSDNNANGSATAVATPKRAIDTNGNVFNVPDYSIKDILSAIPKECYKRDTLWSLHYVARDIAAIAVIGYVGTNYIPVWFPNSSLLRAAAYSLQSFLIGLFGFGLWILAHECGHSAFSDSPAVNDTVGWVLHSWWMVPYFSWKFSHSKHHKATGHMTRDMVFVPYTKEEYLETKNKSLLSEVVEEAPAVTLFNLVAQQLGGLQLYLATNATGQSYPGVPKFFKSHYWPTSPVFDAKDFWYIILSDIGIASTLIINYMWYRAYGAHVVLINWFLPWLWVNHWLVFVTFLQHTDPTMPHYDAQEWTFAKGAAATIDRDFGFIGQHIFHDIIETHVLHHYCSRIPFYNARKATAAIKEVMGQHYRYEGENMWKSLWRVARSCQFVESSDDNGVYMFRNTNKVGPTLHTGSSTNVPSE
ncbi:LAQU0S16e00650g1_1 [Lachancea quebecensis]|uniref:LAQU0S16e00650g1_1 n=1 Tax=Lachancea quebecensis TaxID=1654605 RepID=A0A0P1KY72_9SACH|nr:LAQU0S16e00650g1_1 [Lachancea quebecensis]